MKLTLMCRTNTCAKRQKHTKMMSVTEITMLLEGTKTKTKAKQSQPTTPSSNKSVSIWTSLPHINSVAMATRKNHIVT